MMVNGIILYKVNMVVRGFMEIINKDEVLFCEIC